MKRALSLALAAVLVTGDTALPRDVAGEAEPTLELGIQEANDGNFQAALFTLDAVIRRLAPEAAKKAKDLAQAHLYKGVAYVGLAQEEPAKASFKEALKHDKDLRVTQEKFPARVVRVFEAAKKGKSKSVLYATGGVGAGVLIAGGVAIAAGGTAAALATPPGLETRTFSGTMGPGASGFLCFGAGPTFLTGRGTITATLVELVGLSSAQLSIASCNADRCVANNSADVSVGGAVTLQAMPGQLYGVELSLSSLFTPCPGPARYSIRVTFPRP